MSASCTALAAVRDEFVADRTLVGRAFCRAYAEAADRWFAELFDRVGVDPERFALAAVGGYGREELSPQSDLDVVLLHEGRAPDVKEVADRLWYPVWDQGLKLGHSVRTVKEALALGADDLDTATSLLRIRHLAGAEEPTSELAIKAADQWRRRSKRWLPRLRDAVEARHRQFGEVAFLLEPHLKDGRGGLRDVHALGWLDATGAMLLDDRLSDLDEPYDRLLAARVELHRVTGRAGDRLALQEQDAVAGGLGLDGGDELMARVAAAARTVAWASDEAWARVGSRLSGPRGRLTGADRAVAQGIVLRDRQVHLLNEASPADDPALVLRAAVAAAVHDVLFERASLDRLAAETPPFPDPWPAEARDLLARLLQAGRPAVRVMETLDQRGLLVRILPEWEPTRSRPQRNAYHEFTVDRHLVEAAVGAGGLTGRVDRPDLLVVGALLHDLGKGYPGDHTEVGMELVRRVAATMGYPEPDVATLVAMVEHHLLLPDVATRRDIDDEGTVRLVAERARDAGTLRLLHALTEADSIATGPSAWGPWKAGLVAALVERAANFLAGESVATSAFPSDEQRTLLESGEEVATGEGDRLTVVTRDRPGVFSQIAGVLSLSGLNVLDAAAHSEAGRALSVFRVESSVGRPPQWEKVVREVRQALDGEVALHERVAERARTYAGRRPLAAEPAGPEVRFDNDTSDAATVIEVVAPDAVGVLYRVTRALADVELDIRSAKVQTLGPTVVDSFYVTRDGRKITQAVGRREVERAVLEALDTD